MALYLAFIWLIITSVAASGTGLHSGCCLRALEDGAYLNKSTPLGDYTCRQTFNKNIPAAPEVAVPYSWCRANCAGWTLATASDLSNWANTLTQFILPAVIFSTTIPRRYKSRVPDHLFSFQLNSNEGCCKFFYSCLIATLLACFSFLATLTILIIDHAIWVLIIFASAGPMLFSGLQEACLDYMIISYLKERVSKQDQTRLTSATRFKFLLVILAGNSTPAIGESHQNRLSRNGATSSRLTLLGNAFPLTRHSIVTTRLRLRAILASQSSFGSVVGAPVLFYIGAFFYSTTDLSSKVGHGEMARSLALGTWWMTIVLVAIVNGCLLANNNASTLSMVVGLRVPDLTGPKLSFEWWPAHASNVQPVSIWDRGSNKRALLKDNAAWITYKWEHGIDFYYWSFVTTSTLILAVLPSALAIAISYTYIGVSCRALNILLYAMLQLVLIFMVLWRDWRPISPLSCEHRIRNSLHLLFFFLSVFNSFVGTMLQIMGVYRNCICYIPVSYWLHLDDALVRHLAADTLERRNASMYWTSIGYGSMGFLIITCYMSWRFQQTMKRAFEDQIKRLRPL
jgi:hypothetical protein